MLRKMVIVLAKAAALTSGLTVEAFAHGDAAGIRGPLCGFTPTSQADASFYELLEVGQI